MGSKRSRADVVGCVPSLVDALACLTFLVLPPTPATGGPALDPATSRPSNLCHLLLGHVSTSAHPKTKALGSRPSAEIF
jgi:hypothetical protein